MRRLCVEGWEWLGGRIQCRLVELSLVLEAVEPVRVGAGRGALNSLVDLPVLRERVCRNGVCETLPVIPGSSLKGVLRTVSAVLASRCGMDAHTGLARYGDDCVSSLCGGAKKFDQLRSKAYSAGNLDAVKSVVKGFCPTCLLYGAPSYSGKVYVGEFRPVPGTVSVGVKTGVGINRRTGASVERALYTVEYVEPGSRFEGSIIVRNAPNWLLSLLAASILAIHEGYAKIGGFKSRGMGRVKIVEEGDTPRVTLWPVEEGTLKPLDLEIDVEHVLPSGCRVDGDRAECRGKAAMELLENLAGQWSSVYCGRAASVYDQRKQAARDLCSAIAGGW